MARTDPQVNIRLPADLKDRIDKAALESKRSMNAEIVARLERTFGQETDQSKLEEMYSELQRRHKELLAEFTMFLETDKELHGALKLLTRKYGGELLRMSLRELSDRQFEEIKAALASKDEAWIGSVIAKAIESLESSLRPPSR